MTDTDVAPETPAEPTETPAEPTEATATPKVAKDTTKPCFCSYFEVGDFDPAKVGTDEEEIFTTGCEQTTKRVFAQGHDARLVSFLVDGHFDGYSIRLVQDGKAVNFKTPGEAAARASDSLRDKALAATNNRAAKLAEKQVQKAQREADRAKKAQDAADAKAKKAADKQAAADAKKADAAATKDKPQVEVVAGSAEGDVPALPEGVVKIKVGRWEYDATIDGETGDASFVDGKGDPQTINRDGYRILQDA